jgi:hypothetical protein
MASETTWAALVTEESAPEKDTLHSILLSIARGHVERDVGEGVDEPEAKGREPRWGIINVCRRPVFKLMNPVALNGGAGW